MKLVIDGCAIATVDAAGTEHADGHIVVEEGRIAAIGAGPADHDVPNGVLGPVTVHGDHRAAVDHQCHRGSPVVESVIELVEIRPAAKWTASMIFS